MALAPGLVLLAQLAICAVVVSLAFAYRYTLGAVFVALAKAFYAVEIKLPVLGVRVGLGFLGDAVLTLDNDIRHGFGVAIDNTASAWHRTWHWTTYAFQGMADEIAAISRDTAQAVEAVTINIVPRKFRKDLIALVTLGPVGGLIYSLRHKIEQAAQQVYRDVLRYQRHARRDIALAAAAVAGALTIPRIGRIERDFSDAWKRIKALEKLLTGAGVVGLVLAALARLGLGWTRCSNVSKTGKQICGMNPSLLESLLADTLLIVGTVSLVEFAEGMQDVTAEVAPLIRDFWRAN